MLHFFSFFTENPLLTRQRAEIQALTASSIYKNPFKKDGSTDSKSSSKSAAADTSKSDIENGKGLALIDAWKKPVDKPPTMEFNPKNSRNSRGSKKSLDKKEKVDKAASSGKVGEIFLFSEIFSFTIYFLTFFCRSKHRCFL